MRLPLMVLCFFFNDTATTEIYTLSLHDALPISASVCIHRRRTNAPDYGMDVAARTRVLQRRRRPAYITAPSNKARDRKSTRLNSSHANISYAVFCLKKKKHLTNLRLRALKERSL